MVTPAYDFPEDRPDVHPGPLEHRSPTPSKGSPRGGDAFKPVPFLRKHFPTTFLRLDEGIIAAVRRTAGVEDALSVQGALVVWKTRMFLLFQLVPGGPDMAPNAGEAESVGTAAGPGVGPEVRRKLGPADWMTPETT